MQINMNVDTPARRAYRTGHAAYDLHVEAFHYSPGCDNARKAWSNAHHAYQQLGATLREAWLDGFQANHYDWVFC